LRALIVESQRGRLLGRVFPHHGRAGASLVLIEEVRKRRPPLSGLSDREREVLAWIAGGKRDSEIGHILGIATATVSKHVENLLRKTGARSRTEAAVFLQATTDP
jgi:DNA-binding CsgD family transcriptional regulator